MEAAELHVETGRDLVADIAPAVREFCSGREQADGLSHVFVLVPFIGA